MTDSDRPLVGIMLMHRSPDRRCRGETAGQLCAACTGGFGAVCCSGDLAHAHCVSDETHMAYVWHDALADLPADRAAYFGHCGHVYGVDLSAPCRCGRDCVRNALLHADPRQICLGRRGRQQTAYGLHRRVLPLVWIGPKLNITALEMIRPGLAEWSLLLALGLLGSLAHLLMTWSLRYAPSATLAPMQYLEIPFATMIGFLVFNDLPDPLATVGIVITISAGLYIILREGAIQRRRQIQSRGRPAEEVGVAAPAPHSALTSQA